MKNTIVVLVLIFAALSCNTNKYQVLEGYAQGTTFRIVYKSFSSYNVEIYELLKEFDMALSGYEDNSIISKVNRNDTDVVLNDLFIAFFNKSKEVYDKTDGYFDVTVGPLVNSWGFGITKKMNTDSASIDSIMAFVGMEKVKIENGMVLKEDPRILLDCNAIAQGQSVDFISEFFENKGVENYLVEIGGEVRAHGVNKEGNIWTVGIDKPIEDTSLENRELHAIIALNNKSLATSGNYRKFYEMNGIKYSHSISPKTGYPYRDILLSATIIADECSLADAYSTSCMVMGFEKAKALVEKLDGVEAYFIYSGQAKFEVYQTKGFKKYLIDELKEQKK